MQLRRLEADARDAQGFGTDVRRHANHGDAAGFARRRYVMVMDVVVDADGVGIGLEGLDALCECEEARGGKEEEKAEQR
jgi:hypothetical protein